MSILQFWYNGFARYFSHPTFFQLVNQHKNVPIIKY